jgi:hypothetical protein
MIYINTATTSKKFLAPLPGIEEEEAPTSTWHQQCAHYLPVRDERIIHAILAQVHDRLHGQYLGL